MYEHLAKVYFDPPQKRKALDKKRNVILAALVVANIALVLSLTAVTYNRKPSSLYPKELQLVLFPDLIKLNYNFEKAGKVESSVFNLKGLNARDFNSVEFGVKKNDQGNNVSLRVEFVNQFNEKSELYISDIPVKWSSVSLPLNKFSRITDWSKMSKLVFSIEEWNASASQGAVFIDNLKLVKLR